MFTIVLQRRQPVPNDRELRDVLRRLADRCHGARVAGDPRALVGRARRVDRDDDRADVRDGEVPVGPLRARLADQDDAVAALDAERDQVGGHPLDDRADLGEGQVLPAVRSPVAHGDSLGVRGDRVLEQVGEGLGLGDHDGSFHLTVRVVLTTTLRCPLAATVTVTA